MEATDIINTAQKAQRKQELAHLDYKKKTDQMTEAVQRQARKILLPKAKQFVEENVISYLLRKAKKGERSVQFDLFDVGPSLSYDSSGLEVLKYCQRIPLNSRDKIDSCSGYNTYIVSYEYTQTLFNDFVIEILKSKGFEVYRPYSAHKHIFTVLLFKKESTFAKIATETKENTDIIKMICSVNKTINDLLKACRLLGRNLSDEESKVLIQHIRKIEL